MTYLWALNYLNDETGLSLATRSTSVGYDPNLQSNLSFVLIWNGPRRYSSIAWSRRALVMVASWWPMWLKKVMWHILVYFKHVSPSSIVSPKNLVTHLQPKLFLCRSLRAKIICSSMTHLLMASMVIQSQGPVMVVISPEISRWLIAIKDVWEETYTRAIYKIALPSIA